MRWPSTSSSSQPRSRGQARASASWVISRTPSSLVTSRASTSMSISCSWWASEAISRRGTRVRTASPSMPGETSRRTRSRNRCRCVGVHAAVELLGGLRHRAVDPAGGVVAVDGQGVALAAPPRLQQGVRQQRQGARVVAHLPDEEVHQARLEDQPGLCGRAGDGCAQRLLVQGADEVQAALDQPAEARVLGDLRQAVAAQGQDDRAPGGLLGQPLEEVAALLQVVAEREDLLGLVDGEHGARVGVLRQRGQRLERAADPA